MIRPAKRSDVTALIAFLERAREATQFAGRGWVDRNCAKIQLHHYIDHHGSRSEGGTSCMLAEEGNAIAGLIFGIKLPVENVASVWEASTVHFLVRPGTAASVARELLQGFLRWAESDPRVVQLNVHATAVLASWRPSIEFIEAMGFRNAGIILSRTAQNFSQKQEIK